MLLSLQLSKLQGTTSYFDGNMGRVGVKSDTVCCCHRCCRVVLWWVGNRGHRGPRGLCNIVILFANYGAERLFQSCFFIKTDAD